MDAQSLASIMFDEKTIFGVGNVLVAVSSAVTIIWNGYIGVVLFRRHVCRHQRSIAQGSCFCRHVTAPTHKPFLAA